MNSSHSLLNVTPRIRHFFVAASIGLLTIGQATGQIQSSGDLSDTPDPSGDSISGTFSVGLGTSGGATTSGIMTISNAELTVGTGIIGNRDGANGLVEMTGGQAQWEMTEDGAVGNAGYGELFMSNRAIVDVDDNLVIGVEDTGRGWVDVSGAATILNVGDVFTVGDEGVGNLHSSARARVVTNSGIIGDNVDAQGFVRVTDGSSWRNSANLIVGNAGAGTLRIESGGLVENNSALMSDTSTGQGSAVVTGVGSLWLSRDDLTVGDNNSAELRIEDFGTVQADDDIRIRNGGVVHMSNGVLIGDTISNSGVITGSGRVTGTTTNSASGSIRAGDDDVLTFVSGVTNSGAIDFIDGHLEFQRQVTNAESGLIGGHDGVVRFSGGLVNEGRLGFSSGATDIFGTIASTATGSIQVGGEGVATFYGDVTNAGDLNIEANSHAVFLRNATNSATATLRFEGAQVDPLPAGEPSLGDLLVVDGILVVDGMLSVESANDEDAITAPTEQGTSVSIGLANAQELAGAFASVQYDSTSLEATYPLGDGRSFRSYDAGASVDGIFRSIVYTDTSLDVESYWAVPGDTDGDQDVDFADFLIVSGNFGEAGIWTDGDFDGDGLVAFGDFLQLSSNFGAGGSLGAASVPEPNSAMLFGLALVGLGPARRRRSK